MRKPSPATLIATVALFVALGGVGIAANGESLILGKSDNSATLKTGLSAPVNDKALQLTNTSAGTNATALGLTVASGHAPRRAVAVGSAWSLSFMRAALGARVSVRGLRATR
jgi:hypothetical protein